MKFIPENDEDIIDLVASVGADRCSEDELDCLSEWIENREKYFICDFLDYYVIELLNEDRDIPTLHNQVSPNLVWFKENVVAKLDKDVLDFFRSAFERGEL